jgi:hypothetical protein
VGLEIIDGIREPMTNHSGLRGLCSPPDGCALKTLMGVKGRQKKRLGASRETRSWKSAIFVICYHLPAAASFAHFQNFSAARLSLPFGAAMPKATGFGSGVSCNSFSRRPTV